MPVFHDNVHWTTETLALLGKMPDTQLAKSIGCSAEAVRQQRRKRGIKAYRNWRPNKCAWGETELGLLRSYSDKEIAKIAGRSLEEIAVKRRELKGKF